MEKLQRQDQQIAMQRVRSLLLQLPEPRPGPAGWADLEQELFEAVNKPGVPQHEPGWTERLGYWLRLDLRVPAVATGLALAAVLLGVAVFVRQGVTPMQPLANSRLVRVHGPVTVQDQGAAVPAQPWQLSTHTQELRAGQVFQTSARAGLVARLEPGTGIELRANAKLTVAEASTRRIALQLHSGTVLAKVAKRQPGQVFEVLTPNAVCRVAGTLLRVDVRRMANSTKTRTRLTVTQGAVEFVSRDHPKSVEVVRAGQTATLGQAPMRKPRRVRNLLPLVKALDALKASLQSEHAVSGQIGLLSVTSPEPGAMVRLNNQVAGFTPLLVELPQGNHLVTVQQPGSAPVQKTVAVTPNQVASVDAPGPEKAMVQAPRPQPAVRPRTQRAAPAAVRPESKPVAPASRVTVTERPEYQQALDLMKQKEFHKAAAVFRQLEHDQGLTHQDRHLIVKNLSNCYKAQKEWILACQSLDRLIALSQRPAVKDKLLWETITIKVSHLKDYRGAEKDLEQYRKQYPQGLWARDAQRKLGDVRYLLKKHHKAADVFEEYVKKYAKAHDAPEVVYQLANLWSADLKDCSKAIPWYSRLIRDYPKNQYVEGALFWRADCLSRLGRVAEAREEYRKYLSMFPNGRWKKASTERLHKEG